MAEPVASACKEHAGSFTPDRRPRVWRDGKWHDARRLAWEQAWGGVLAPDLGVTSVCGNAHCVEPSHLAITFRGARPPQRSGPPPRLTPDQREEVRRSTESTRTLAARWGLSQSTIQRIRAR